MKLRLPDPLKPLGQLAYDLWWTWDDGARRLFHDTDPQGWTDSYHNPVAMLAEISYSRAMSLSEDPVFLARIDEVVGRWRQHVSDVGPTRTRVPGASAQRPVAYFCMEYGIHECLPIYSGGLGTLAGDHLKSASDLGIPMVAIGLFYREGYFNQKIEGHEQVESYERMDPNLLPMTPVLTPEGKPLTVPVPDNQGGYNVRVWEVKVGRTRLFLLDANVNGVSWWHQQYTRRLYGGTSETRLAQEILLGIGGVRALKAMGFDPIAYHVNEGHAAYLVLELMAQEMAKGIPLEQAMYRAKNQTVFTTHTPVLAGHDRFTWDQVQDAIMLYRDTVGFPPGFIMDLGRIWPGDVGAPTCMTIAALRMSRASNAVSRLHGEVTHEMWRDLFTQQNPAPLAGKVAAPRPPPIMSITNGVHPPTWVSPAISALFDQYVPGWDRAWMEPDEWEQAVNEIPAEALWEAHKTARKALQSWLTFYGNPKIDLDSLIIGFARRFAPYKRGNMIFKEPERLHRLLESGPVTLLYAGKAHPADLRGHAIISEILEWQEDPRFKSSILFIPDYDMQTGRFLVQGCDLWLNTPRRPNEASGTSGQKAAMQGVLNLSILDGWWPEAYDGTNGWAIDPTTHDNPHNQEQDDADTEALYRVLERQVVPTWQDRTEGIPQEWVERMRRSIATCLPRFDSRRMVAEYAGMYKPV